MPKKKYTRREILKMVLFTLTAGVAAPSAGYGYASKIEPNWIDMNKIELALPHLSPAFNRYRIAQINDIHLGSWMNRERLSRVIDLINQESPDAVAIVGDIVSNIDPAVQKAINAEFSRLQAKDGIFAALGNHDHWTDAQKVTQFLTGSGVKVLLNDIHSIHRQDQFLHLCAIDDFWEKQHDLEKILDKLPPEGCAILMAHEPDFADISSASGRFDLQISGHSHGGQVVVPLIGPITLPPHAKKYPIGLYRVNQMLQYTNRGVGMISPHVRFNCRPEITLFTLKTS